MLLDAIFDNNIDHTGKWNRTQQKTPYTIDCSCVWIQDRYEIGGVLIVLREEAESDGSDRIVTP